MSLLKTVLLTSLILNGSSLNGGEHGNTMDRETKRTNALIPSVSALEPLISCVVDDDCFHLNTYFLCVPEIVGGDSDNKVCKHKKIFPV